MIKPRLFTPGPTPVPEKVLLRMAEPMIHHRSAEFTAIMQRVSGNLQTLFQTEEPVLTLTSSGTGAAEAIMTSIFSRGEKGIFINNGKFAERWGKMMHTFGMETVEIAVEWGKTVREEDLIATLHAHPDAVCVWMVHSETSTGTYSDVRRLAAIIREYSSALVCVDGITSIGAHECLTDAWGIDALVTGSQKGLMIPPGLAFVALSKRAWKKAETASLPSYYFDLRKALKSWKENTTPWTPAANLIIALDTALEMLTHEGVSAVWERHRKLSQSFRAGVKALGLRLFSESPSFAVTAIYLPEKGKVFLSELKNKHKIAVAGGQDALKDVIFRVSHLGYYDEGDMLCVLSAMEQALKVSGHSFEPGAGVYAFQREWMK